MPTSTRVNALIYQPHFLNINENQGAKRQDIEKVMKY